MQEKKCKKCNKYKEHLRGNICFECIKKRKQEWYRINLDRERERSKQYKIKNKIKVKEYSKVYNKLYRNKNKEILSNKAKERWKINREKYIESHKKWLSLKSNSFKEGLASKQKLYMTSYVSKLKWDVLSAYSNNELKCNCCGEKDIRFLSLDHIKNNGAKERRELKRYGYGFYAYLRKNGFPQNGYQVLCYNCNCAKRNYNDVCPHKLPILQF